MSRPVSVSVGSVLFPALLKSMQQFQLPTTKQVICSVLNEDNFLKSKACSTLWIKNFFS